MHTDIGGYDEAVRRDAFLLGNLRKIGEGFTTVADLEPGMRVRIPKHGDKMATITAIQPFGTLGKAFTVQYVFNDTGTFGWHVMDRELSYDWTIVGPPEHSELHTDTSDSGAYDESTGTLAEIRKKPVYAPPRSGKGVPSFTAKRSEMDEQHREDFNSIYYEVEPWQFTVGRATLSNGVVVFKAKCFPKGTTENPYEDENAVKSLDGPPFYALTVALSVLPGRGESIPFHVKRFFDASGTLCWPKGGSNFQDIFCPMGDLHHMETRAFGNTVPSQDGYFLAMVSGSVSDFLGTDEVKMNLWKLFNPLVRELALRPEVRELEEPFAHVGHEELHTDIGGYDEAVSV